MGLGKTAATVGGGVVAGKVINEALDNEGKDKSLGKTAAAVGGGIVAAKLIDGALDEREEKKEQEKKGEAQEKDGDGLTKVASVVAAGAAVKAAHDTGQMKKMMKEGQQGSKENPFGPTGASLPEPGAKPSSFEQAVRQQQGNVQNQADNRGLNQSGPGVDRDFSI